MMGRCLIISVMVILVVNYGQSDMYSSMEHLKNLVIFEKDAAVELDNYIRAEESRLIQLRQLTEDYLQHSNIALIDPEQYVSNPINSYLLIKKLTLDWNTKVHSLLESPEIAKAKQKIGTVTENFPGYEDLEGAAAGILRLQDTYKLDSSKIAQGDLDGHESAKLSADDCYRIGRYAYNLNDYYHTIDWMRQALTIYQSEENKTANLSEILDYLAFSFYEQGNTKYALQLTNELLAIEPAHERALSNKAYYEHVLLVGKADAHAQGEGEPTKGKRQLDEYRQSQEFQTYEALCRDEDVIPYHFTHKLVCRYVTNNHPLLILRPAKTEVMYLDPFVMLIHEAMSDQQMENIKSMASDKLNRATVHNSATGKLETAFYRVSKSAWMKRNEYPIVKDLRLKFEAISDVNFETGEDMQIANYGVGGQYEPHYDFARKRENAFEDYKQGNRIATWMTYMSDVAKGGATVFPIIGIKIFPMKGTAIFWYNLYKNGDGILKTRHAACPVLVGSKWVSNIWLHEGGNEFKRPCSLNQHE